MFSANSSQVSDDKLFVEDVFSTFLYTGNGTSQTITNGINLSGQGGLVWTKNRNSSSFNSLIDTVRGADKTIWSNSSSAGSTYTDAITAFGSTGYTMGADATGDQVNKNAFTYASWTFRKAPNFFDIVTYTGTGANQNIAHNLGSAPGCIMVKRTDTTGDWQVYHRSLANTQYVVLNSSAVAATGTTRWNSTTPTATEFTVGTDASVNASGGTYVAYLYAHDTSSTGIIQCGSVTVAGGNPVNVNLGWEPQWFLSKSAIDSAGNWFITDSMRGFVSGVEAGSSDDAVLLPSSSTAEFTTAIGAPTATGVVTGLSGTSTWIYIAIRRGPMRTPTLGTSVFMPWTRTGTGTTTIVSSTTFPPDLLVSQQRNGEQAGWFDRLRGRAASLSSASNGAEATTTTTTNDLVSFNMNGITVGVNQQQSVNTNGAAFIDWNFRRAPGFFDEVCYAGLNSTQTLNHNLGVAPELIIVKNRTTAGSGWPVWSTPFSGTNDTMLLNTTAAKSGSGLFTTTPPTSTVFTVGVDTWINSSGNNYVAYLFASAPGVSKVGSYTGNGSSQTINCGFAAGARFVMIKRTDSTGDWYVWDTARGIVAGNDPHLSLNTTAAEVTSNDTIDTDSSGFVVNQVAATNVNVNAATYIYLAIA